MSIANEIQRLQNAKQALKAKINAKNDSEHQIDDETLDAFGPFVDNIERLKIFDTVEEMNNDNDKHLGDKALVYGSVASPIEEDTTFRKFVKPSGNIVLQQNIMQYINEFKDIDLSELSDGEELSKSFYRDIAFGDDEMEPEHDFQINGIEVTVAQNYDEQTGEYGDWQYSFGIGGYFTVPEEQYPPEYEGGHPMFKIAFTSSDGINFVPDFGISFFEDPEIYFPIFTPQDYIESEVDINFSTVEGEWNDIISKFLFTDEVKFNGVYEVEEGENETLVYELIGPFLQNKSIEVNENGTISISADSGYDALNTVALNVNVSGGGGSTEENDVNFYDYDGTLVDSYSAEDFLQLSAMPANPSHEGLVAQGWNWDLADAQDYVEEYGILDVGQTYTTASGLSEFDIELTPATGLSVTLNMNGTKNWGDGTSNTGTTHTYLTPGNYTITCDGVINQTTTTNGLFGQGSGSYNYYVKAARITGVSTIFQAAFSRCQDLSSIILSNDVTTVQNNLADNCRKLKNFIVPKNINSSIKYLCNDNPSLKNISLSKNISVSEILCSNCFILKRIVLPESFLALGSNSFRDNKAIKSIVLSDNISSLNGYTIYGCSVLESIKASKKLISIGSNCLQSLGNLKIFDCSKVEAVPSLGGTFYASKLLKIIVPDSLYNDWIAATNWTTYADYIVRESDYNA